jgi:hypothetical protein
VRIVEAVIRCAALAVLALTHAACLDGGSSAPKTCMPDDIGQVLVRIERRQESQQALDLVKRFDALGRRGAIAAVYEFYMFRNKPAFYFASAPGSLRREELLKDVVAALHGDPPQKEARELQSDGVTFLCLDFTRGRGLIGLSAACAWSDGTRSGYGVRIEGGDVEETLRYTAEARRVSLQRAGRGCNDTARLSELANTPQTLENVARDVVAAIKGYECKVLASYHASGAEALFRANIRPDRSVSSMKDPLERVCFALGTLGYPQSETMKVRTISETDTQARLKLTASGPLEDEEAELWLVKEGNEWKIDAKWSLAQVHNHVAKLNILGEASNVHGHLMRTGRFVDDKDTIASAAHAVASVSPGLAFDSASPEEAYIKVGGSDYACVSLRSESGEFFLMRIDREGITRALLAKAPTECPAKRLGNRW